MVAEMGQGQPAQSNSPEDRDAWGLDANGCAPNCPIRILGEQSGVRQSAYPGNPELASTNATRAVKRQQGFQEGEGYYGTSYSDQGTAARFFKTFPPDSLFAGMDEEAQP